MVLEPQSAQIELIACDDEDNLAFVYAASQACICSLPAAASQALAPFHFVPCQQPTVQGLKVVYSDHLTNLSHNAV
jgi:hypothetical protein